MLHENMSKNDSICDIIRYRFIAKLQNFLIAPRNCENQLTIEGTECSGCLCCICRQVNWTVEQSFAVI